MMLKKKGQKNSTFGSSSSITEEKRNLQSNSSLGVNGRITTDSSQDSTRTFDSTMNKSDSQVGFSLNSQESTRLSINGINNRNSSNNSSNFSKNDVGYSSFNKFDHSFFNDALKNKALETNSIVVAAIDFGTTYSGYAFAFTRDPDNIHVMRRWEGGDPSQFNQKIPTIILLHPDGNFHSFGFVARDSYNDLDHKDAKKWLYFEKFKMNLLNGLDLKKDLLIEALNGSSYPALKVFAHALKYFKKHLMQELANQSAVKISDEDITWVLTVPAIWKQQSKQFMRLAAYEAGLTSADTPEKLIIALEPESASIYCRKLRLRDNAIQETMSQHDDSALDKTIEGDASKYIIVDCGGGTVDIAVHEMDPTTGGLKELHKGVGGPHGAAIVDQMFATLLCNIFGVDFIESFKKKRPSSWVELMNNFESRKRTTRPFGQNPVNISLPYAFAQYYKKKTKKDVQTAIKKFKNAGIKWCDQGMIRLTPELMVSLFDPVLREIVLVIREVLEKPSLNDVKHMFLVGGFAESPLLQHRIRHEFGSTMPVIVPNDVSFSIVKGAVIFGLDPRIVRLRRAKLTYGVGVLNLFLPNQHPESKKVVRDGVAWCRDVFDIFVRCDDSVALGESVTRLYAPARQEQLTTVINIYCTEKTNPCFTTEDGVFHTGQLRIQTPKLTAEEIENLSKKQNHTHRELRATMIFGDTEVKVSALDVATNQIANAAIDFLNY